MFADFDDLAARFPAASDRGRAETLLEDASMWLHGMYPAIPDPPGERLAGVLRMVVCSMVKRALLADVSDNVSQLSHSAGPFSESVSYRNSEGNLFLTAQERQLLEKMLAGSVAGFRSVEAGWA